MSGLLRQGHSGAFVLVARALGPPLVARIDSASVLPAVMCWASHDSFVRPWRTRLR